MNPTDPKNETCKCCPYCRFTLDGMREDCDPPMGECPLEYKSHRYDCNPVTGLETHLPY